jgi:integrase
MSETPISPLRQRMLEDMSLRGFTPDTQGDYIRAVKKLAAFLGRSPDTATAEDLRAFQLHLTASGVQPPTINTTVTVLRFFFKVTLDRPETTRHLVFVYEPRKLPRVLAPEEVLRLLEAAPGPKHKAALSVAYGAGLRAMEVVALKVSDIDSKRMMLRVEQGKGRKDRFAMLSPQLLELLRDWWRIAHPPVWMFPGRNRISPMTTRQLNRVCHMAAELASLRFVARINIRAQSGPRSDIYVRRTYSGRPSSSIRFSEATAMATSVICRPLVRERSASPITRL